MSRNKELRIGFIIYSLQGGGAERNLINLSYYLKQRNIFGNIIVIDDVNDYVREYYKEFKQLTVIPLLSRHESFTKLFILLRSPILLYRLIRLIKKNSYEVLVGNDLYSIYLTTFVGILLQKKTVLNLVSSFENGIKELSLPFRMIHKIIFYTCCLLVNKIICISKGLAFELETFYKVKRNKIVVIYNGIAYQKIQKIKQSVIKKDTLKLSSKDNILITCGRLDQQKGHKFLIRSFQLIKQGMKNVKLIILGKGKLKEELILLTKKLGLIDSILFLDFTSDPYFYFKLSDIFMFPSLYEGFGNVLIEAMACGLPVISTDCAYGPREILSGSIIKYPTIPLRKIIYCKYGILAPLFTDKILKESNNTIEEKKFAETVVRLLKSKKLLNKYKKRGKERACYFSLRRMGNAYLRTLNSL